MLRLLLYPVSFLYGVGVFIRNMLFDYGILPSRHFSTPVISVGNITVGGTGKTPHVEYLVRLLTKDFKVSVLSRGYKRKTKGLHIASDKPNSAEIGDEPTQMKLKYPEIDLIVDADRVRGIEKLIERKNELVILDDAYQHRYVKPGLSILLIDYNRPIYKDHLLPVGNLREHRQAKNRADIIVFTKTPEKVKPIDKRIALERIKAYAYQSVYFSCFKYGHFTSVFGNNVKISDDFHNNHELYTVILLTGIASSKSIINYLESYTTDIEHLEYADHVNYTKAKLNRITSLYESVDNDKKIIITTEKDAVKLRELKDVNKTLINNTFYLPIEVKILDNEVKFNEQIIDYVKKNKRYS